MGGEAICVSTLTIDRQNHKNCTNGHTKRAPLQGVHTYLYPCPLSCVSTNLILHISSRLLTSWEALCINTDLHRSGSIWFQGADAVSYQRTIWPRRKRGLDLRKCDPFLHQTPTYIHISPLAPPLPRTSPARFPSGVSADNLRWGWKRKKRERRRRAAMQVLYGTVGCSPGPKAKPGSLFSLLNQ